jgi:hypothetical protein
VRESRPPGSVRGVLSNGHPYRDSGCGEVMCMGAERDEGFNWHTLQRFIAGYQPPTKPVPARNGTYAPSPRRLATKSSGEIASGAKQERAERKKVLALAQARKVDVILVTELTRWGRSARFAARSLTCFKFRFVSSPHTTSQGTKKLAIACSRPLLHAFALWMSPTTFQAPSGCFFQTVTYVPFSVAVLPVLSLVANS